jgi:hypothetical protein
LRGPQPWQIQSYLAGPTNTGTNLLLQFRAGALLVKQYTQHWTPKPTADAAQLPADLSCPCCACPTVESVAHLLFECPTYAHLPNDSGRDHLLSAIASLLTTEQLIEWSHLSLSDRVDALKGDRWLGGRTSALHPALQKYLRAAWLARKTRIDSPETSEAAEAAAVDAGDHPSGEDHNYTVTADAELPEAQTTQVSNRGSRASLCPVAPPVRETCPLPMGHDPTMLLYPTQQKAPSGERSRSNGSTGNPAAAQQQQQPVVVATNYRPSNGRVANGFNATA